MTAILQTDRATWYTCPECERKEVIPRDPAFAPLVIHPGDDGAEHVTEDPDAAALAAAINAIVEAA